MTTYWKSQDRKFCEFCKCWFADNKVSISFHENGKKHKDNVKKHITQLSKRSAKEHKQKEKVKNDLKKMETAAMNAYLKDIENNADLTSQSIKKLLELNGDSTEDIVVSSNTATKNTPVWKEVKNEQNDTSYFWNIETNETTWDPPENYIALKKQKEKNDKEEQKRLQNLKKQREEEAEMEAKARASRESMRVFAVEKDKPPPYRSAPFGPAQCGKPYGSWKPIVKQPEQKIDLQLPKSKKEIIPPPVVMEPEIIQFKEKRVESLGEGPVEFKKRKLNSNKRNIRQKCDDD